MLKPLLLLPSIILTTTSAAFTCRQSNLALIDGTQNPNGFCSDTIQGEIPSANRMVAQRIIRPRQGQRFGINEPIPVDVRVLNLNTGFFSDPLTQYYTEPQRLGENGFIDGHSHITIQQLFGETDVPDPATPDFFVGLNDPAVEGILSVVVEAGLPRAGEFRICTMAGAFTHQPVLMPIAARGAQDDCVRFFVR